MTISYANDVKDDRMTAVLTQLDAGSGAGKLEIGTAGMSTVLATITLNDPAGTVAAQALTLSGFPKTQAAVATGTAAAARVRDSDDNDVLDASLTVGTSGTDIVLDSVAVNSGQDVTINSAVINHF